MNHTLQNRNEVGSSDSAASVVVNSAIIVGIPKTSAADLSISSLTSYARNGYNNGIHNEYAAE